MENKSFKVFYAIEPNFGFGPKPTLARLGETHKVVRTVQAADLEEVYASMQGEVWSPHGEARELIKSLGLKHTSMSVGDVVLDEEAKRYWMVAFIGFEELK